MRSSIKSILLWILAAGALLAPAAEARSAAGAAARAQRERREHREQGAATAQALSFDGLTERLRDLLDRLLGAAAGDDQPAGSGTGAPSGGAPKPEGPKSDPYG